MKLWRSRLPVRLARSGPSALLDITIIVLTGSPQVSMAVSPECMREHYHTVSSSCPCVGKRERFVQWALDTLAGENGETCKRWKRLHIVLGPWIYRIDPHQSEEDGILLRGLTYPTPALTEVHMGELSFALIHRLGQYIVYYHMHQFSKKFISGTATSQDHCPYGVLRRLVFPACPSRASPLRGSQRIFAELFRYGTRHPSNLYLSTLPKPKNSS